MEDIINTYIKSIKNSRTEDELIRKSKDYTEWLTWLKGKKIITTEEFDHCLQKLNKLISSEIDTSTHRKSKIIHTLKNPFFYVGLFLLILLLSTSYYFYIHDSAGSVANERVFRVLPYQGKLLDSQGMPISSKRDIVFRLYSSENAKSAFYTGRCIGEKGIVPDYQGSFTIVIGRDCGMNSIDSYYFDKKSDIFLGVQVGSDKELSPRQKVSTSGYSSDASMLQGFELGTKPRSIPFINSEGNIAFEGKKSGIKSLNGNLSIESQTLILKTLDQKNGSILIQPGIGSNTIVGTGKFAVGTFKPEYLLSVDGVEPYSAVATIRNLSTSEEPEMSVLNLALGTPPTGVESKFIRFFAGSTQDSLESEIGAISLHNEGVAYETSGADFAEYFEVNEKRNVRHGMVMSLSSNGVHLSKKGDHVVGVVTDSAGFVGNKKDHSEDQILIGLEGQLKTYVTTYKGDILIGDPIVLSEIDGHGEKGTKYNEDELIGYALENLDSSTTEDCSPDIFQKYSIKQSIKCGKVNILLR